MRKARAITTAQHTAELARRREEFGASLMIIEKARSKR